jgi:hypothetical protein
MRLLGCLVPFGALLLSSACGDEESKPKGGGGSCFPSSAECYVAGPDGPGAECMAKLDNTGSKLWQGRLTSIEVTAPPQLASTFAQEQIIDKGVFLNLGDSCKEYGDGTFNWMFEMNSETGRLTTGGGLPVTDPAAGGCFITMTNAPLPVAPIDVPVTVDGRKFTATGIDVYVPIFTSPTNLENPVILPLRGVSFAGDFNDDSHNCIGKFNRETLDPTQNCRYTTDFERPWATGGTISGHVTVEDADQVFIDLLGASLCAYLGGVNLWKGSDGYCKTSDRWQAGERPEGDTCSRAGESCTDAWKLEGTFAAAAFKVNGDCRP